jgi:hypothetical protein
MRYFKAALIYALEHTLSSKLLVTLLKLLQIWKEETGRGIRINKIRDEYIPWDGLV